MIPVKEFHLVHATDALNLEQILATDSLLSISKSKYEGSEFYEEELNKFNYDKKIFTGLIMPDENNKPNFTINNAVSGRVYLILNPKLIEDYAQCSLNLTDGNEVSFPFFCNNWNFGSNKDCIKYDTTKSLKDNLNIWRNTHIEYKKNRIQKLKSIARLKIDFEKLVTWSIYFTPLNELAVQFSKNKKGQCIEGEIPLDKYLQAIYVYEDEDDEGEIKELASEYPQYNWIFG